MDESVSHDLCAQCLLNTHVFEHGLRQESRERRRFSLVSVSQALPPSLHASADDCFSARGALRNER